MDDLNGGVLLCLTFVCFLVLMEEEMVNPFAQGGSSQVQNNQSCEFQSIQLSY
jgi:hypothetical protein